MPQTSSFDRDREVLDPQQFNRPEFDRHVLDPQMNMNKPIKINKTNKNRIDLLIDMKF